jgi:hypothetical protein
LTPAAEVLLVIRMSTEIYERKWSRSWHAVEGRWERRRACS